MSLLGIDVSRTACKVAAFSPEGKLVASVSVEYDILRCRSDRAEPDAARHAQYTERLDDYRRLRESRHE